MRETVMFEHWDLQPEFERFGHRRNYGAGEPHRRQHGFFASEHSEAGQRGQSGRGRHLNQGRRHGCRLSRGDIKHILLTLLDEQPQHGYQLMREMEARQGGFYRSSPGSVYPTLQMLEDGGYVTSERVEGRRVYTITESGKQLLARDDRSVGMTRPVEFQPQLLELNHAVGDLAEAVKQVARSGNPDRASRVRELLNQVKREIYSILAEEDG